MFYEFGEMAALCFAVLSESIEQHFFFIVAKAFYCY